MTPSGNGAILSFIPIVLCHSRDVHPMWVKSFTETLSEKVPEF